MKKILLIEDDLGIQEYIKDLLEEHEYQVQNFADGISGLNYLKTELVDLVILDLGLPKLTGEAVCKDIRSKYPHLPIIILTAKDANDDIVHGLNLGADDYITKPFVADILVARIKARLREDEGTVLRIGDLELNTQTVEVKRGGKNISLSQHEFKLLQYLLSNKERVLTREMILNRVWEYSLDVDTRVVDVYIGYLRKKIDHGFNNQLIHSVRGFGYVIREK